MRRLSIIIYGAALLTGTLVVDGLGVVGDGQRGAASAIAADHGGGVARRGAHRVGAPPPSVPDEGSAAALGQFLTLGEQSGYDLIDPACSASPSGGNDFTYTCYAMTTLGEPFIARTSLSSTDVVEFEILAQPGQPLDPSATGQAADDARQGRSTPSATSTHCSPAIPARSPRCSSTRPPVRLRKPTRSSRSSSDRRWWSTVADCRGRVTSISRRMVS